MVRSDSLLQVLQSSYLSTHGRTGATQRGVFPAWYNRCRSAAGLELPSLVYRRAPSAVRFPRGTIGAFAGLLVKEVIDETLLRGFRPSVPEASRILSL